MMLPSASRTDALYPPRREVTLMISRASNLAPCQTAAVRSVERPTGAEEVPAQWNSISRAHARPRKRAGECVGEGKASGAA